MKEKPHPETASYFRKEAETLVLFSPPEDLYPDYLTIDELRQECAIQQKMLALQQRKIDELSGGRTACIRTGEVLNEVENNKYENVKINEQLAAKERFIKGIADNAPGLISYWSKDLVCTFTNQKAKEWLGTELKDIVGNTMQAVLGDELFASNYPYIQCALRGEKVQFERGGFNIYGNASYIWIQYVPDFEDGIVKGFYSLVTDITELKNTQLAIEFEEKDKEALINSSRDYICSIDKDYNIITANAAYKKIMESVTGIPVRKGDNVRLGSGFDEATWQLWEGFFKRALAGESFTIETSTKPENMDWELWTECSFSPIIQNNEITGLACYSRDITERKAAEKQIKENKAQLDLILNTVTDLIYVIKVEADMRLRLVLTNRVLENIHPFKKEDAAGLYLEEYMPADRYEIVKEKIAWAIETKQTVTWEQSYRNGNTTKFGIQNVTPVFDEQGNCVQVIGSMYDITERKTAEQAIAESYKKLADYKFALDQSSMVFIADADGIIRYVNDNLCRVSKYSFDELVGKSPHILNSNYHPKEFFGGLWQTIQSGKVWRGQIKDVAKDGTYFWVDSTITPFLDASGKPYQFLAIDTDITKTKLAEDALRVSNERFQYVTQATFDAIWDWDIAKREIFWGDGYKTLFGHQAGTHKYEASQALSIEIHPDERENVLEGLWSAINGNSSYWSADYRFRKSNGHYAYINDKAIIIRDDAGKATRMIGAMQDTTERLRALEDLERSELKFRSMVHNINDIVTLVDKKGFVLYSSPSLKTVLGYMPEEVNGLKMFNLLHPDDYKKSKDIFRNVLSVKGNSGVIEFRYRHKNGHYLIMESQGNNQLDNPTINAVILTTRDITRRKEKEAERMLLVYELMEKNADLKQFSYITSHNLRAPLTNLMAICNLLDSDGLTPEDTPTLIDAFKISTAKLNETLNDLIKILIIKDGRSQEIERVYFDRVLAEVKTSAVSLIEASGAVIDSNFSAGPSVNFYAMYMESILFNLLSNAIKYANPDRKPVMTIKTSEDEKFVVLTFTDNGIGMNMARVKNKIFGLYQRFHSGIDGKGIGLYLVHSQVTALGGNITVESNEGEGTTFTIWFKKELFKGL